jgi:hypothetical protein
MFSQLFQIEGRLRDGNNMNGVVLSLFLFVALLAPQGWAARAESSSAPVVSEGVGSRAIGMGASESKIAAAALPNKIRALAAVIERARVFAVKEKVVLEGNGEVFNNSNGATFVFSQFPLQRVANYKNRIFIFLVGPTPNFSKEDTLKTSWRRDFITFIASKPDIGKLFVFVLPEPIDYNWSAVDQKGSSQNERIERQLLWENSFLEHAYKTGFVAMYAMASWKGNAMPTGRFEIGEALIRNPPGAPLCVPPDSQSVEWATVHAKLSGATLSATKEQFFEDIYEFAKERARTFTE